MQQPRHAVRETKKLMNLYLHRNAAQMLDTQLARQLTATLSEEHHAIASAFFKNHQQG
jgi:hypothetical protein